MLGLRDCTLAFLAVSEGVRLDAWYLIQDHYTVPHTVNEEYT